METFASLYCFVTSISPSEESWEKFLAASIRLVRLAFLTFCHKYQFRIPLHAKNKPFLLHWHDIGWNAIRIIRCIRACHVLECTGRHNRSFPKFNWNHNQSWVLVYATYIEVQVMLWFQQNQNNNLMGHPVVPSRRGLLVESKRTRHRRGIWRMAMAMVVTDGTNRNRTHTDKCF